MPDNLIRKGAITKQLVAAGIARPHIVGAGGTPPDEPEAWVDPYIGLPWKDLGRDRNGVDCWGLHRLPLLEVFGCDTPLFVSGYIGCSRHDVADIAPLIEAGREGWQVVAEAPSYRDLMRGVPSPPRAAADYWLCPIMAARPGDSLLLRENGAASHVALVAGGGHMLHIEEGTDSVCEPYVDGRYRRRIVGIYRHPGLMP